MQEIIGFLHWYNIRRTQHECRSFCQRETRVIFYILYGWFTASFWKRGNWSFLSDQSVDSVLTVEEAALQLFLEVLPRRLGVAGSTRWRWKEHNGPFAAISVVTLDHLPTAQTLGGCLDNHKWILECLDLEIGLYYSNLNRVYAIQWRKIWWTWMILTHVCRLAVFLRVCFCLSRPPASYCEGMRGLPYLGLWQSHVPPICACAGAVPLKPAEVSWFVRSLSWQMLKSVD